MAKGHSTDEIEASVTLMQMISSQLPHHWPAMGTAPELKSTTVRRVSILIFAGSLAALLAVDAAMALGVGSMNEAGGGFYLGILFSQAALVAVLMAWAPWSFFSRMILGIPLLVGLVFCLGAAFFQSDAPFEVLWIAILPLTACVANCIPLVYMRVTAGTRIIWHGTHTGSDQHNQHQFGIRQILVATAMIAAILALGRAALASLDVDSAGVQFPQLLIVFAILFVFSVVTSWVAIFFCLGAKRILVWILPVILFYSAATGLEIGAYYLGMGRGPSDMPLLFLYLQGGQLLGIAAPLLALRGAGTFLVRTGIARG